LNIWLVIVSAAAGAIAGDNAGYWLGRKGGIALVARYGRKVGLNEAKLVRVRAFFDRHGARTVFIGRFIALLRSWAAALAGVARMPYATFSLYNALGGVTWAAIFGGLGYAFARNLPRLQRYVGQVSLALVLLAALGIVVLLGVRWFRNNSDRLGTAVTARWRQLASGEYLGLHLTIGFLVSLTALWVFGAVTEDVVHHDPLTVVDLQAAAWLRAHASPVGDRIAVVVASLGSPAALAALALVVAAVLAYRRWWIVLMGWIAAFAGGATLDWVLRQLIQRPPPVGATAFISGGSFSFPSGYAMDSLIGYGMLAYLLIAHWPWGRRHRVGVTSFIFTLVLAIGLSGLYLGAHYPSDVIGGYAAGVVWLAACVTGIEIALRQRGLAPRSRGTTIAR
jgi:undecaprenyl-diphosphatase